MSFKLPELVQETTNTDSSPFTLNGRSGTFRGFSDELSTGDTTIATIWTTGSPIPVYEIYKGTWTSGPSLFTTGTFIKSSTGAPIVWAGSASKNVTIGLPGLTMRTLIEAIVNGTTGVLELASGSPIATFATTAIGSVGRAILADTTAADVRTEIVALNRSLSEQTLMFSSGDTIHFSGGVPVRLAAGTSNDGKYLRVVAGLPAWSSNLRGYIDGFNLSRSSATVLNVTSGVSVSEDSARKLLETTATETVTLSVGGSSPGTVGGLGATRAINTWYHVFAIYKDSDGTTDVYADTSVTAANIPTGYTSYRRVGSFLTDATGSGELPAVFYQQDGDRFTWHTPHNDLALTAGSTGSGTLRTLSVPLGVRVTAILAVYNNSTVTGGEHAIYISDPSGTDLAVSASTGVASLGVYTSGGSGSGSEAVSYVECMTNTAKQVRSRNLTTNDFSISTIGWIDTRGKS